MEIRRFKQLKSCTFAEDLRSIKSLEDQGYTVNGNPTIEDSPYGHAMVFDGTGDYVDAGIADFLDRGTGNWSVSFRVMVTDNSVRQGLFCNKDLSDNDTGIAIYLESTNRLSVKVANGSTSDSITSTVAALTNNVSANIVCVSDGTSSKIYKDGVDITSSTSIDGTLNIKDGKNLFIGANNNGGPPNTLLTGQMSQVIFFDRALTATEALQLHNQTVFNYKDNLVSEWDMSNINPKDLIGDNDGVGTDVTVVDGANGGKGLDFNGSTSRITTTNPSPLGDLSYAVWLNVNSLGEDGAGQIIGDTKTVFTVLTPNRFRFTSEGFPSDASSANNSYVLGVNQLAGIARDSAGVCNFYTNGLLSGSADQDSKTPVLDTNDIIIGANAAGGRAFDGVISRIQQYGAELSGLQYEDICAQSTLLKQPRSLRNGLINHYPLNIDSKDLINGDDGTDTNVTYTGTSKNGMGAATFNGASSKVDIGDITCLNSASAFSVSFWLNHTDLLAGSDDFFGKVIDINNNIQIGTFTNTFLFRVENANSATASFDATNIMPPKNWNHVVAIYNGGGANNIDKIQLYVNGVQVTLAFSGTFPTTTADLSGASALIGNGFASTDGQLSDFKLYDVSLTGDEALKLFKQTSPNYIQVDKPIDQIPDVADSSLVGSWLNKCTVNSAKDLSSNNNDGVATDVKFNKVGGTFDGSTSMISLTAGSEFDGNNITAVAWFKTTASASTGDGIVGRLNGTGGTLNWSIGLTNDEYYCWMQDGTGYNVLQSTDLDLNNGAWHQVVQVIDASASTRTVYIDGAYHNSDAYDGTLSTDQTKIIIGKGYNTGAMFYTGNIKGVKVYTEAKTASWIASEYAKSVPDSSLLLHLIDGDRDLSRFDHPLTNIITKTGNGMVFDGADSKIDTGSDMVGTSATSVCCWIKPRSVGEGTQGRILDNGRTEFWTAGSNVIKFNSDGNNAVASAVNAIVLNTWQHVCVTRDATGIANIYVNGVLSGVANQDSGTPTAGTTNLTIGNNDGQAVAFDGTIKDLKIINRVLSVEEILLDFEHTRKYY